jgi:hypothetical protein
MSDKEYLRKLVKAIVFILAFAVSGVASIGLIGLFMGVATGVGGFLISGAATSVTAAGGGVAKLIPKLFAPSAKALASEVGPAAGTWAKLQQAYMMETGNVGTCSQISYTLPGGGRTANFAYDCGINKNGVAYWIAENRENLGECPRGNAWILFMNSGDSEPVVRLPENKNCQKLTPNFSKLGVSEQDKEAKQQSNQAEEAAKQAEEAAKQAAELIMKGLGSAETQADEAARQAAELIMQGLGSMETPSNNDVELAKKELEAAAKKWQKDGKAAKEGAFFSFKAGGGEGGYTWKATTKKQIGDCPAKSVIEMGHEGCERWNDVPGKCKALAPKTVTSYKGDSDC